MPKRNSGTQARRSSAIHRAAIGMTLRRLLLASVLFVAGGWLIATQSLPYVLAATRTDTALWLNPDHPAPLLTKALQLRDTLYLNPSNDGARDPADPSTGGSDHVGQPQAAAGDDERRHLQTQIANLARRILVAEPLNAKAYQLLGEAGRDPDKVRILMQAAVRRSRRSTNAVYWLLNDSTARGDVRQALDYADILLRTRPRLTQHVVAYVAHIAESGPGGLDAVVTRLREKPKWRSTVLDALPGAVRHQTTPLEILLTLKTLGPSLEVTEYASYLNFLVRKRQISAAYGAWLQLQSKEQLGRVGLLNNGDFERAASSTPFDWNAGRSQNALTEFAMHPSRPQSLSLHVIFGTGRVNFTGISQILRLAPGRYELLGEMTGALQAKRGLQWRLRCDRGQQLGASDVINATYPNWRDFKVDFSVPENNECVAQVIELAHMSRSASEKFITGEMWFDNLSIKRTERQ